MRTTPASQLHSAPWRTGGVRTAERPSRRQPGVGSVRDPRRAVRPAPISVAVSPVPWGSAAPTGASPRSGPMRSGPAGRNAARWCPRGTSARPSCSRSRPAEPDRTPPGRAVRRRAPPDPERGPAWHQPGPRRPIAWCHESLRLDAGRDAESSRRYPRLAKRDARQPQRARRSARRTSVTAHPHAPGALGDDDRHAKAPERSYARPAIA